MVKMTLECLECGKVFKRSARSAMAEFPCPKCHGYDTEPVSDFDLVGEFTAYDAALEASHSDADPGL